MAQFDVYVNPNPESRQSVPFVVDVQSGLIDALPTRLVMPLSRIGAGQARFPVNLCPLVEIEETTGLRNMRDETGAARCASQ